MDFSFRILLWLIKFTILVALSGGLVSVTRTMGREAIKAHRSGLVSLRQLNRSLVGQ